MNNRNKGRMYRTIGSKGECMDIEKFEIGYKEYPDKAKGWSGGVYYPRKEVVKRIQTQQDEVKDIPTAIDTVINGTLKISSRTWTETEETGFGIYTYVEGPIFVLKTGLKDYKWTVIFSNQGREPIRVNCYADEVLMIKDAMIMPGCDQEISFINCSIHENTTLQFFVSDAATCKEDAGFNSLYIKDIEYIECEEKKPGIKPTIFLASDSTVQTYEKFYYPQMGWGQVFEKYFCPGEELTEYMSDDRIYPQCHVYEKESIIIENRSIGARSSRSFIDEGKWNALLRRARPGDYCFIQWAHNDATAVRPNRYVSVSEFDGFLMKYIDSCRSRGIYPVLVTPVSRRNCDDNNGEFPLSFGEYRDVMIEVGRREHVPTIDLCRMSNEYMKKVGPEEAKDLHLWCPAGAYPDGAYKDGVSDNTHLQEYGALIYARMVAGAILTMEGFEEIDKLKPYVDISFEPFKEPLLVKEGPGRLDTATDIPTGFAMQELYVADSMANFLLIWNDVEGARSYNVYRKGSVDFQFFPLRSVTVKEKKSASVLPFRLPAADVYQVKVTAVFEDGSESESSRIIEFRA